LYDGAEDEAFPWEYLFSTLLPGGPYCSARQPFGNQGGAGDRPSETEVLPCIHRAPRESPTDPLDADLLKVGRLSLLLAVAGSLWSWPVGVVPRDRQPAG
jgi:hypothetical protein